MKTFARGCLAGLVLFAMAIGAVLGLRWGLIRLFRGADPTISAAVVAAGATAIVSIASVALGKYFERRDRIESELRREKLPVYVALVKGLIDIVWHTDTDDADELAAKLEPLMFDVTPELLIWGGDGVVSAWSRWKRGQSQSTNPVENMFVFEELLMAVRKDFGHSNKNLADGDILGLFISDIDNYLPRGSITSFQADESEPGATTA